ncbi:hypothetical protein O9X98_11125 [Agrobacterium salinitolerans]|nr:hypothetical protein [Agrobacterium salinitolerans]
MSNPNRISSRYSFFDVEASGLMRGSFPVNIGWSLHGATFSVLIKPADTWNEDKWDAVAQSIHGMSLLYLRRHGKDVRQVARILNDRLRREIVYCDSVDRDTEWTDMVFSAAGVRREFEIRSIGPLLGGMGVTAKDAYATFEAARETHPPDGIAIHGVMHLHAVVDSLEKQGIIKV